jgi:hypothetical protein
MFVNSAVKKQTRFAGTGKNFFLLFLKEIMHDGCLFCLLYQIAVFIPKPLPTFRRPAFSQVSFVNKVSETPAML